MRRKLAGLFAAVGVVLMAVAFAASAVGDHAAVITTAPGSIVALLLAVGASEREA